MTWENIQPLIDALGGGLSAVVILGLGWAFWQERKESRRVAEKSFDTMLDVVVKNTEAMNTLASKIEGS